jgi:S-adenosylmethionine/arginine decarboxylase-like enzyme
MQTLNGYHALIDGRSRQTSHWSPALVYDFLGEAVRLARMTLIAGPWTATLNETVCGNAILAESHVTVHLDRQSGGAHIDLFSCKEFDLDQFELLCVERFGLEAWHRELRRRDAPQPVKELA